MFSTTAIFGRSCRKLRLNSHASARKMPLAPMRVLPLGPGVNRMVCAPDGQRLYALCEDADSVMCLSLRSGQPLLLARAGVQPRDMTLTSEGLLIAGGAQCEAQLFCPRSLQLTSCLATPGLCVGAACVGNRCCTLSMTEQATGVLCVHHAEGSFHVLSEIDALPGGLCAAENGLWTLWWNGAALLDAQGEHRFLLDGFAERAAAFPGGVIVCQPSLPQSVLITAQGAQLLEGGSDVCVYETPLP